MKSRILPTTIASLFLGTALSNATTVFTDTFDSGTGNWYKASTTGVLSNSSGKLSWAENGNGVPEIIGRSFTSQTLAVGETIRLTFDFSWTTTNNTNILRAGLYNTTNAITADDWAGLNAIGPWEGYYSFVRDSSTSNNVARIDANSLTNGTNTAPTNAGTDIDTVVTNFDILDNVTYQGMFEVTRATATTTTTLFTLSTTSGEITTNHFNVTGTTTTLYNTFNAVVIKTGADAPVALFDNVQVSFIPEPSAAVLGAFGVLALLRRRRN